jgi:hypothetical protein
MLDPHQLGPIRARERLSCECCGADLGYPKDPPIPTPPGYSMMADVEKQRAWERENPPHTRYRAPPPPAKGSFASNVERLEPETRGTKRRKRR